MMSGLLRRAGGRPLAAGRNAGGAATGNECREARPVIPDDLRYTADHEWIRPTNDGSVRVGITDYAQNSLGDIVFVQMPEPGSTVQAGEPLGEVESTKSVSDVLAPVSGTVTARNDELDSTPESVNSDPYGDGWLIEIQPDDASAVDALLDADGYAAVVSEQ
jgi:glycine cleavage system H protein